MSARIEALRAAALRAAARHEPGQRPLSDRIRELERGAARRSRLGRRSSSPTFATSRRPRRSPASRRSCRSASLPRDLAERLEGRIQFEADALPFSQHQVLGSGGLELVPDDGDRRGAAGDQGRRRDREAAALGTRRRPRLRSAHRGDVGRSQREGDRVAAARSSCMPTAPTSSRSRWRSRPARTGRGRTAGPTDEIVEAGTLVVVDWGARIGGYCSDCTRTLATGHLSKELRRAYDVCLEAQLAAVDGIRPGMTRRRGRLSSRAT